MVAYLRKGGWHSLTRAVYAGVAAGLAVSAVGGYLLYNASNQESHIHFLNEYLYGRV